MVFKQAVRNRMFRLLVRTSCLAHRQAVSGVCRNLLRTSPTPFRMQCAKYNYCPEGED